MSRPGAAALATLLLLGGGDARADWRWFRGDPSGTAFVRIETGAPPGKPIEPWRFRAGSHVWGYQPGMTVWSSPAVGLVQGVPLLFVGSYDHNVYALDARTGARRWRFTTGGGVYATPALWLPARGRPMLFVTAADRSVYALDAGSGRRLWVHSVQGWRPTIGGARLASPALLRVGGEQRLLVAHWVWDKSLAGNMQRGGVSALAARDGTQRWSVTLGDNQLSSPLGAMVGRRPMVFVASSNGTLYALSGEDGRTLWRRTERDAIKASPVLVRSPLGPRLVLGSKFGIVRCLDAASGREVWRFKTGHWVDGSAAVATVGGRQLVLIGSYDTALYALDAASGSELWRYNAAGGIFASPAVARAKGTVQVLFTAWDHHLHCVNAADGSLLWSAFLGRPIWDSVSLGDSIWSSPVVAEIDGQQVAYVGSYSGPLYAVPLAQAAKQALARPGSNLRFWSTMPLVLLVVTLLTLGITRRHRRRAPGRP